MIILWIGCHYFHGPIARKASDFAEEVYLNIFNIGDPPSPVDDIGLLLAFDHIDYTDLPKRPNHTINILDIQPGHKDWCAARSSWFELSFKVSFMH